MSVLLLIDFFGSYAYTYSELRLNDSYSMTNYLQEVNMEDYKLGKKVSIITIIVNIILSLFKIIAGIFGRSSAMIADGIHTASDVITTVIVIIGLSIASKEADKDHPYGHEKFESAMAKLISMLLFATGLYLGYQGISVLIKGEYSRPGGIALVAAALSILVKEGMYRYTIITARTIQSTSMEADAWHHRSDAFTSIGTFVGILGAMFGLEFLDPIAAIVVSLFVMKVGIDLYLKSIDELVDKSADTNTLEDIKSLSLATQGVEEIRDLKTRVFGNRIFVDLEISVDRNLSVEQGHLIAENVHDAIENNIPSVKHCMVHVEPF